LAADLVAFPELSLSNYDPEIADAVAITSDDHRLAVFRAFADETLFFSSAAGGNCRLSKHH